MAASGSNPGNGIDWSGFNAKNFGMTAGLGGIGAGIGGMFGSGSQNPADAGMKYLDQIPGAIQGYQQPYMDAGQHALGNLSGQYDQLLNDPGGKLNQIGGGFHQSPGFQFALQQALGGSGHAAAAGGMAGSPQHEQQNMGIATQMGNQDYYNWLGQATGLYGQGLSGSQGMAQMGQNSAMNMSDQIAQMLAAKSQLGYNGAANQNQSMASNFGNLAGGAATLAAFL